jgi:hypothetical protein
MQSQRYSMHMEANWAETVSCAELELSVPKQLSSSDDECSICSVSDI